MVNSVPTGVSEGCPTAHSPAMCWQELIANNPSLHHLKVCQLPSWVRWPSLFQLGSQLSLVFGFKDPDGSIAPGLICARNVYAFRSQCRVVRWCYPPPSPAKREAAATAKKARNARSASKSIAGTSHPPAPPPVSVMQLTTLQTSALHKDGNMSAIPELAAALASLSKQAPTSSPSSARSRMWAAKAAQRAADAATAAAFAAPQA